MMYLPASTQRQRGIREDFSKVDVFGNLVRGGQCEKGKKDHK
jgi:hypothetical protein